MQITICFLCRIVRKCYVHHKWDNARKQCIRKFAYLKKNIYGYGNKFANFLFECLNFFFLACFEEYFGIECVAKCEYPHYGPLCTPICNCTREDCHHKSGCKSLLGIVILKHIMIQHTHIYRLVIYFYFFPLNLLYFMTDH